LSCNEQICYIQVCEPKEKIAGNLFKYGDEKPNIKYKTQNPAHGKLEQCKGYTASHHAKLYQ